MYSTVSNSELVQDLARTYLVKRRRDGLALDFVAAVEWAARCLDVRNQVEAPEVARIANRLSESFGWGHRA